MDAASTPVELTVATLLSVAGWLDDSFALLVSEVFGAESVGIASTIIDASSFSVATGLSVANGDVAEGETASAGAVAVESGLGEFKFWLCKKYQPPARMASGSNSSNDFFNNVSAGF